MLVTRHTRRARLRARDGEGGSALVTVLVVMLVLGLLTVTLAAAVVNTTRTTVGVRGSLQAQAAADAGMSAAIAAVKSADVCTATVPAGTVPGSGSGAAYTATVSCDAAHTAVTITATGTADGSTSTVTAVYGLVAQTTEVSDPSKTPVGLVLYDASTMGQVTLLAHGGNEPQIVAVTGTFGCRLTVPGNLLVGGSVTSSDGCNVQGDIWAGGTVDFSGGATSVRGDITAAGTGLSKINSAVGAATAGAPLSLVRTGGPLDLTWSGARMHADVLARGDVTVNNRVIDGSVTLPSSASTSINGGRIAGGTVKSGSIPAVPPPTVPGWFDYRYKASDWPGANVLTLRASGSGSGTCDAFNAWPNQGWKDLATATGTVVVDARACTRLTSNAGGNPAPAIKADNVVILAQRFDTTGLKMTAAAGTSPKVWFITEDTVADGKPSCPLGADRANFNTNGADLEGVRSLIYTPCRLSVSGGGVLLGSLYTNGFDSGGQITIKGELMTLPGQARPDGGYGNSGAIEVETGHYSLGALVSRRAGGAP
jgi:Tfp pilus assembly protein PilX